MKKYVLIALTVALLIVGVSLFFFMKSYGSDESKQVVEISKIVFQSMLAGSVTFCGLLLTIASQEHQNRRQKALERCPHFVVINATGVSASRDVSSINASERVTVCCGTKTVRTIDCTLCNCKSNYGLNVFLVGNPAKINLGCFSTEQRKLKLALNDGEGKLFLYFEDVMGFKYQQEIEYVLNSEKVYQFVSKQPQRRKK